MNSPEVSNLAVSLSTNVIKFYSPGTGQYLGECKGHAGRINEISFFAPSSVHILHSCSSDGTVRAWDTRIFKEVRADFLGEFKCLLSHSYFVLCWVVYQFILCICLYVIN